MKKINLKKILLNLDKFGYYVLPSYFNEKICNYFKSQLKKLPDGKIYKKFHGKSAKMYYNLTSKNFNFFKLAFEKNILRVCEKYFSNGAYKKDKYVFQFDHLHARKIYKPCKAQNLHLDSRICGVYPPTSIHFFIYLDDVNKKNSGATKLVPKSHKIKRYPTKKDDKAAIELNVKKGSVLIMNSSCWHGSSKKNNFIDRDLLILVYTRWFLRQQFALPFDLKKNFIKKLTNKQKIILGFNNYPPINEIQRIRRRGELVDYQRQRK